ncbi:NKG2-E type II integral membrane protein, partial [Varanus komodoensis]
VKKITACLASDTGIYSGVLLCMMLSITAFALAVLYLHKLHRNAVLEKAFLKMKEAMIKRQPELQNVPDEVIREEIQKLADRLALLALEGAELHNAIDEISRKLRTDWIVYQEALYLLNKTPRIWKESQEFCLGQNSVLVCIDKPEEEVLVTWKAKIPSNWNLCRIS